MTSSVGTRRDVRGVVRSVYQPIVDLESGQVVAYEALARGAGPLSGLTPFQLFRHAASLHAEAELDWECRAAACRGALDARLPAGIPLFVNAEPRWLGTFCPPHLRPTLEQAAARLQLVVEITERALVHDPAGLLAAVRDLRAQGAGIALDDVGAVPESLALLPLVDPDVVKLDLRLVQARTDRDIALIAAAVRAHAERTGAQILAEGIETEEHLQRALVLGATLGQGWHLGRPAALPHRPRPAAGLRDLAFTRANPPEVSTPFALTERAGTRLAPRETTKDLLLPMSQLLEGYPLTAAEPPVLLATFQDAAHFTPGTRRRYATLAPRCSFVAALGAGMPSQPVPDVPAVRGADLAPSDRLRGEWAVVVVGPHFAGALLAKDLGDGEREPGGRDGDRRFRFVVTHDRDVVVDAARAVASRVAPLD